PGAVPESPLAPTPWRSSRPRKQLPDNAAVAFYPPRNRWKYTRRPHRSNPALGPLWENPVNVLSVTLTFSAPVGPSESPPRLGRGNASHHAHRAETPVTVKVPWAAWTNRDYS